MSAVNRFKSWGLAIACVSVALLGVFKDQVAPLVGIGPRVEVSAFELRQLREAGKHIAETPAIEIRLREDQHGHVAVRSYESDHCTGLLFVPSDPRRKARTIFVIEDADGDAPPSLAFSDAPAVSLFASPAFAGGGCSGRCVDPHPGQYQESYEETGDACWLRVWRSWPEGCRHYQMFHRCSGSFETNRDGSPRVTWVCCAH